MTISIPSKSEKTASTLVDCLRILSWQIYKSSNKDLKDANGESIKGLELYDIFKQEWASHEIHKMDLPKVQKLVKDLGYSEEELLEIRSKYYQNQSNYKQQTQSTQSKVRQLNQKYQEADDYDPKPF